MSSQKNACFLEVSEIPFRNGPLGPEIGLSPSFPMFWYTCRRDKPKSASPRQRSATANELEHWKMQEYVLIYQSGEKKNSFHLC